MILVVLSLGLYVIANVLYVRLLSTPDYVLHAYLRHSDPSISGYIVFNSQLAFLFGSYIRIIVVFTSISALIWIAAGLVIFWRKSDDWMTLLAAFGLITTGVAFSPQLYTMYVLADAHSLLRMLITIVTALGWGSIGLFAYLFPNGRFVPRWTVCLALGYLAYQIPQNVPVSSPVSIEQWPPLLLAVVEGSVLISPICAQLYRYRHFSNGVERQQAKWVVFGIVLTLLAQAVIFLPPLFFPPLARSDMPRSLYTLIGACSFPIMLNMIPLTIVFAMLRYRLWDIDVLINRTLVYGALTVLLACIYGGLVIAFQVLLRGLFSQANDVAIVISTLAIAALFQPLRRRIQEGIDRRFYRRKYDAAKTLAIFAARLRLRDNIELTTLTDDLLGLVEETMQPAHVSLWLRSSQSAEKQSTEHGGHHPVA